MLRKKSIEDLWDMGQLKRKMCNLYILGIQEGENKRKLEEMFDIKMSEKCSKLIANTKPQIQEKPKTPSRTNTKISTPGNIIYKVKKKEKS